MWRKAEDFLRRLQQDKIKLHCASFNLGRQSTFQVLGELGIQREGGGKKEWEGGRGIHSLDKQNTEDINFRC